MINFAFYLPTHLYVGIDQEEKVGKLIKADGGSNILLVYGGGSIKKIGLYDKVIKALDDEGITYHELKDIHPNPRMDKVYEGISLVRENKIDYILAVGGGSVIDTAKSIAHGVFYDGDCFDFNLKKAVPGKAMKVGVILTIAASGSEMSNSCVMSKGDKKAGFNVETNRPRFAIENPALTFSVSPTQTAYGSVDIISHSLERYFNQSDDYCLADDFALGLIKEVIKSTLKVIKEPTNYDARATLMVASGFSHNGLTGIGKVFSFPIHALEHEVSGLHENIAHGAGLACLIPAYLTILEGEEREKIAHFGREVFSIQEKDDEHASKLTILAIKKFIEQIGLSYHLKDYGFLPSDIDIIVNERIQSDIKGHIVLTKEIIRQIFIQAL